MGIWQKWNLSSWCGLPPGQPEVVRPEPAWGGAHTVVLLCPALGEMGAGAAHTGEAPVWS